MIYLRVLSFAAALMSAPFVQAQTSVEIPITQASDVAARALMADNPALALQIAEAVLAQRPDDRTALVVVAAAAPRLGDPAKGRAAGARAWAVSQTDVQKYEAARLTALAAANEERFTLSTFWLRRALTVAPNDEARDQTLRDANAVSRRNPWATQLSFSLTPSSNLNGGSETDTLIVDGVSTGGQFSEDSQALAGWRAVLSLGTSYRFQENQQSRSTVALRYQLARSKVTDDTTVPDESFDTSVAEISLGHDRAMQNGTLSLRASRRKTDYRDLDSSTGTTVGEYYLTGRIGLSRQFSINEQTAMSLSYDREKVEYSLTAIGEVHRNIFDTSVTYRLPFGDQLRANVGFSESNSPNANYTSAMQSIGVAYSWAEPIGPVTLSIGGSLSYTDYPDFNLPLANIENGRQDTTYSTFANIGFPTVSYAGFSPGLRIDASKTASNVSRYDRTTFSAGLTISSQF